MYHYKMLTFLLSPSLCRVRVVRQCVQRSGCHTDDELVPGGQQEAESAAEETQRGVQAVLTAPSID